MKLLNNGGQIDSIIERRSIRKYKEVFLVGSKLMTIGAYSIDLCQYRYKTKHCGSFSGKEEVLSHGIIYRKTCR